MAPSTGGPFAPETLTGWYVGLAVGDGVVVVVVVVVAALLTNASRIARQAHAGIAAVERSRQNTLVLWDLQRLNASIRRVTHDVRAARVGMGG